MDARAHFEGKRITVMGLGLLGRGLGDVQYLAEQGAELIVTDLKTAEQLATSLEALKKFLQPNDRVLDYGCGIGTDGLRLIKQGYRVGFADYDNPSIKYLRWRLDRRGITSPTAEIYNVEGDVPSGFDVAYSFDVIEHVEDPMGFLDQLESKAKIVAVNLLEPDPRDDVHMHKPLPIEAIRARAKTHELLHDHKYHGRSHLLIYRVREP